MTLVITSGKAADCDIISFHEKTDVEFCEMSDEEIIALAEENGLV